MKAPGFIRVVFACMSVTAAASDLPRGVYKVSELEQAITQATEKKQPLIFIYSDINSSCGLCTGATQDSFKAFRSRGTLVYINSQGEDMRTVPASVQQLRRDPAIGRVIPMIMVTSADGAKPIKAISYDEIKGGQAAKAARGLRRTLEEADATGSEAKAADTPPKADPESIAPEQVWQNAEGKTITAAVRKIDATMVTFLLPGGKTVNYPLEKLSQESREKLRALAK